MNDTGLPAGGQRVSAPSPVRIETVEVVGYKAIDRLRLTLPRPRPSGEPDITVIGGPEGCGRTALLEALAIGLSFGSAGGRRGLSRGDRGLVPALVRCGDSGLTVTVTLAAAAGRATARVAIGREGTLTVDVDPRFHAWASMYEGPTSSLTTIVLRPGDAVPVPFALLLPASRRAGLEPDLPDPGDEAAWDVLGRLGRLVAGAPLVAIETGGPPGLGVDIPAEGGLDVDAADLAGLLTGQGADLPAGTARPWWCLGAGERALIALVYQVWAASRHRPMVILIDEPELHIHPERHGWLIRLLADFAPHNQYLITSLSAEIASAVPGRRRGLLVPARPRRPDDSASVPSTSRTNCGEPPEALTPESPVPESCAPESCAPESRAPESSKAASPPTVQPAPSTAVPSSASGDSGSWLGDRADNPRAAEGGEPS